METRSKFHIRVESEEKYHELLAYLEDTGIYVSWSFKETMPTNLGWIVLAIDVIEDKWVVQWNTDRWVKGLQGIQQGEVLELVL